MSWMVFHMQKRGTLYNSKIINKYPDSAYVHGNQSFCWSHNFEEEGIRFYLKHFSSHSSVICFGKRSQLYLEDFSILAECLTAARSCNVLADLDVSADFGGFTDPSSSSVMKIISRQIIFWGNEVRVCSFTEYYTDTVLTEDPYGWRRNTSAHREKLIADYFLLKHEPHCRKICLRLLSLVKIHVSLWVYSF